MKRILVTCAAGAVAVVAASATAGDGATYLFNDEQYTSLNDSLLAFTADDFWLEDFESGVLSQPGLSFSSGFIRAPSVATDSVDLDDGVLDGLGQDGWSFKANLALEGVIWSFDAEALGGLPTQVGIAWTDGTEGEVVTFEAYDANGDSLGVMITPILGDDSFFGTTADDRFIGAIFAGGISAFKINGKSLSIEMDHVQYGLIVPGPGALALLGLAGIMGRRRRRA